jgi:beta-galactosidase
MQLKKFGCNAYRSSHNPMTPALLDICDRLGILVIEENRLTGINKEHTDLLGRMIRRDRNHPSIILWSVGNEEWGLEWNEFGTRIAESMREYCHRFDPTRLMTVASSSGPHILIPADVAGYNYILQNPVEEHRANYPERCALGSEETTGCGTRGVYFEAPAGRKRNAVEAGDGRMVAFNRYKHGPDSVYNCIERGWKFYAERDYLAGLFYWTGFDYRGEPNPMTFPATSSEFGILDYCGFPKDEAYYLKAWWTDEPVLHILPHWNLDGHEGEKVSVWAYSNCDEVQLTVNGKNLGRKKMPVNGHLEWDAVYKPGYVKAVGYKNGRKVMETRIETAGAPVEAVWTHEAVGDIIVANVKMVDAKGRFVPTANCELEFKAPSDEWKILGWGNGDPAFQYVERNHEKDSIKIHTFNGCAQVIIQKK